MRAIPTIAIAVVLAVGGSAWVVATEHREAAPPGDFTPRPRPDWPLTGDAAVELRRQALRQAKVRLSAPRVPVLEHDMGSPLICRFLAEAPSGTSPKFSCVLDGGEVVKVKYGTNPEISTEVAATRLLSALGFPTDRMRLAPKVRCYGCPRHPFLAMHLLHLTRTSSWFADRSGGSGYSEFHWVAVEERFRGFPIELPDRKGWGWWELAHVDPASGASRTDVDALRLIAVFLNHWDNKDENQRLVCLDPPGEPNRPCTRSLAMIQDLGATFGPSKANLAQWQSLPVWSDPRSCRVSLRSLPYHGGTFPDATITEEARSLIAAQLTAFTDADIQKLFATARFPEHYGSTDDREDLAAWVAAFKGRVRQIVEAGPCPTSNPNSQLPNFHHGRPYISCITISPECIRRYG